MSASCERDWAPSEAEAAGARTEPLVLAVPHRPRPDPGSAVPMPYVACCTERRRGSPRALSSWAEPMKNYPLEEASQAAAVVGAEVSSVKGGISLLDYLIYLIYKKTT